MIKITYEITFRVKAVTQPCESVCVVGDCEMLGGWNPHYALRLRNEGSPRRREGDNDVKNKHEKGDIWSRTICLTGVKDYHYRYFIGNVFDSDHEETDRHVIVTQWETNINPRKFSPKEFICDPEQYDCSPAVFGDYDDKYSITKGWLTGQSEIQIRFHRNPVQMWKSSHKEQAYRIRCTPVDHRYRDQMDEDDDSGDYLPQTLPGTMSTNVLVSVLREDECSAVTQHPYGHVYQRDDFMIFRVQSFEFEYMGFQFDFYVHDPSASPGSNPKLVGYCHILPMTGVKSNAIKTLPIIGLKHKPIGEMKVDFLIVKSLREPLCDMEVSYQTYWKSERGAIDVGHRGMGSSYKHKKLATVRENTIRSLASAGKHGADFVEFDVHLSKDLVPIIYHDFEVCITYRKKKRGELELIALPVKDLMLTELQSMKLTHTSTRSASVQDVIDSEDLDPADLQPFPTLKQCFQAIQPHVGFNVEVKYPLQLKDGTWEQGNYFDINMFVDKILAVVLKTAGSRRLIFSSFNPDICILLQLKQNKYPVLYLTNGETLIYEPYFDVRTLTIDVAIKFALSENLLGIDVLTDCLLKNLQQIDKAKKAKIVLFCWGEDNNDAETIDSLKQHGVDGIIYDRIDSLKSVKSNVFLMEEKERVKLLEQMDHTVLSRIEVVIDPAELGLSDSEINI